MKSPMKNSICDICLDSHNLPEDGLVECSCCNLITHQSCYGGDIYESIPENQWTCEACRYKKKYPERAASCKFCPNKKRGGLKEVKIVNLEERIWAHVQCINWIPEINFSSDW